MKNQLLTLLALALFALASCQPAANEQTADAAVVDATGAADYALFDKKVDVIKSLFQAHSNEDLDAISNMVADTLQWSPPHYNGNEWLGKEDYLAALQGYHNEFDNIEFKEGISGIADANASNNGFWSGSVFPESTATNTPDVIRVYGTWTAVHTETGKEVGVKWYGLGWVNEAGQIARFTDYFDVHGLAAQVAAE